MNNMLSIEGNEIQFNFDITEFQKELDSIIVFSKLSGFNIRITRHLSYLEIGILKPRGLMMALYAEFHYNNKECFPVFSKAICCNYAGKYICKNNEDLMSFTQKVKNSLMEED